MTCNDCVSHYPNDYRATLHHSDFIRFCPIHANAEVLLAALEALVSGWDSGNVSWEHAYAQARAAIQAAKS